MISHDRQDQCGPSLAQVVSSTPASGPAQTTGYPFKDHRGHNHEVPQGKIAPGTRSRR